MAEKEMVHLGDGLYEELKEEDKGKIVVSETVKDRHGKTHSGTLLKEGEEYLES